MKLQRFIIREFKFTFFLLLFFAAFAVGNRGLGGSLLVTLTACVVSVAWYALNCLLGGYNWSSERSAFSQAMQGMIVIILCIMLFAEILFYVVICNNNGDSTVSAGDAWIYWKQYIHRIILGAVGLATVSALLLSCLESEWVDESDRFDSRGRPQ